MCPEENNSFSIVTKFTVSYPAVFEPIRVSQTEKKILFHYIHNLNSRMNFEKRGVFFKS